MYFKSEVVICLRHWGDGGSEFCDDPTTHVLAKFCHERVASAVDVDIPDPQIPASREDQEPRLPRGVNRESVRRAWIRTTPARLNNISDPALLSMSTCG